MEPNHRYFILNKPIQMVSQFVSSHNVQLLGSLDFHFPPGTHAVGRLDSNSEGLLILTTNKKVTRLLFQAEKPHTRTYLVLVSGIVSEENLQALRTGVIFKIKGGENYKTAPCDVLIIPDPGLSFPSPYIVTEHIAYTWINITLTEGKYHQVRKMIGAIHHKVKRLVRVSIEHIHLGNLKPGEILEMDETAFFRALNITDY